MAQSRLWWSLPLFVFFAFLTPLSSAWAQLSRPLIWAADAEGGEPYVFKDAASEGKHTGFEVDLAEALSRELGRRIEFKQYDFKNLTLGLQRGDFDFAMNGLEITPDRLEKVRFTRPYYVFKLQLAVRADETRIRSLADCGRRGVTVGVLEETAAERLLDQWGIPKKTYESQRASFLDLENGRIQAVLADLPVIVYYVRGNENLKALQPPVGGKGHYAIACRKDNETLTAEVDAALDRLRTKGELRALYTRWGIWNEQQEELMPANAFYEVGETEVQGAPRERQDWTFGRYIHDLLAGAWRTVEITFLSFPIAILVGMLVALLRLYGPRPVQWLAVAYVEFFRGIPVLLLLFFLYFALPSVGKGLGLGEWLNLSPMTAAVLGLGLNYAAYEAEIYRAGIGAVPEGQWEAAASLGMTPTLTFRRIILPQALRVILPPSTSDFVALFKDTSIVSGITLIELSKTFQILSTSGASYEQIARIGAVTAGLYLLMSLPLGYLSRYLEEKWSGA